MIVGVTDISMTPESSFQPQNFGGQLIIWGL